VSTVAALLLLAGCATDRNGGPTIAPAIGETRSSPTATSQPSTTTPMPDAPAFSEDTERQSRSGSGEADLVLTDVRVAEAEGFDRIVLEFGGTGTPGWVVDYVDDAVLDGSGERVALGGNAILDIYASGTTWPAPGYYRGPSRFTPVNGGDVNDVFVGGTFEGYTQVLAGIEGDPVPFRVFALTAPSRLVIDVVDEDAGATP
jgi:hypothetical protein